MRQAPIQIVPYDPEWVTKFEDEKASLETLLAAWRRGPIEHVGSTAVVGLCAKPVIDVMVGVASLAESEPAKAVLLHAGYQYSEYKSEVMHWFCKPSFATRTHHLHLIPFESPLWRDRLKFRDCLRSDSRLVAEYTALKLALASKFEFDREAYTEGKSPFINRILEAAGYWTCVIMSVMRLLGALMVAGCLLLLACGGSDSESPMSIGDYCESAGTAFCDRVQDCKLASFSACFKLFQADCCLDDMSCDDTPKNTASLRTLEQRCVPALSEQTCSDVEAGGVPDACSASP